MLALVLLVLLCRVLCFDVAWSDLQLPTAEHTDVTTTNNPVLLVSTLDGSLLGVDRSSGRLLWTLQEDPVLTQSQDSGLLGFKFLPNPKDGGLYVLNGKKDQLERIPLTIPELVQVSPVKSSDGLLYTAKKSDVWLVIDPLTGNKLYSMTNAGLTLHTCPAVDADKRALYVARTAYTVTVFDIESKEVRWNTTFWDYAATAYVQQRVDDHLHLVSASDGTVVSVDALTGQHNWERDFGSPVMSIYDVRGGGLHRLPSVTVASDMLGSLSASSLLAIQADIPSIKASDNTLQ